MIDQKNVKDALNIEVSMSSDMVNAMTIWVQMYENQASWLTGEIKSMNLPAAIAAEISRTITIEMDVQLGESSRAVFLQEA